jgi:putative transposase
VIDAYSRKIVGWQLATHMRTDLVLDAPKMALAQRGTGADGELIHHSDRGSQGGFNRSSQRLVMEVVRDGCWKASAGDSSDARSDVVAESFVDSFKTELITDRVWQTRSQLELAIVEYLGWFNKARLHGSLGDVPPAEYEQQHADREPTTLVGATV